MVTVGCILSPFLQLQAVLHMGFAQLAFGRQLTFSEFTFQVFPGVTLLKVFLIGIGMLILQGLLMLYIWPLSIETDPERPLKWYYPLQCSYWCGARSSDPRQNRLIGFVDGEEDDELLPA